MIFIASLLESILAWVWISRVVDISECPNILDTLAMSAPPRIIFVANECRRPWNLIILIPAFLQRLLK